jgi:hypothetical protein
MVNLMRGLKGMTQWMMRSGADIAMNISRLAVPDTGTIGMNIPTGCKDACVPCQRKVLATSPCRLT